MLLISRIDTIFLSALSANQGRPTAITESTYDEVLLHNPRQHQDSCKHITVENLFWWRLQLSQIQSRLSAVLNRHETVNARIDALSEIDSALIQWRDNIPVECRPGNGILVSGDTYHLVALLHLQYFNILRSAHWTCIMVIPQTGDLLNTHSNPRMRASDVICLSVARLFVTTLNE